MKKLMLDVDALAVESFSTVAADAAETRGTVLARGVTIADTVRYTEDDIYCAPGVAPTVDTCVYPCVRPEDTRYRRQQPHALRYLQYRNFEDQG